MTWDVTISDTLANSHLARTSLVAGAAAGAAALLKIRKYDDLLPSNDSAPLPLKPWGLSTRGTAISVGTGEESLPYIR